MTRIGTSHFTSLESAIRYYQPYGYRYSDVQRKLNDGEIHIGEPRMKEGQQLKVDPSEGRYVVVEP